MANMQMAPATYMQAASGYMPYTPRIAGTDISTPRYVVGAPGTTAPMTAQAPVPAPAAAPVQMPVARIQNSMASMAVAQPAPIQSPVQNARYVSRPSQVSSMMAYPQVAPTAYTSAPVAAYTQVGQTVGQYIPSAGVQQQYVPVKSGAAGYCPVSVKEAWQNHFDAFGEQNVEKIALDYDNTSRVTVYNNVDGSKSVFTGLEEIKGMFKGLFADLTDLSTLDAPVIDVDETPGIGGQVFLVWKCPGCGYNTATDTFIFGPDFKIKFQNIVITK